MGLLNHCRDDMEYEPKHDDEFGYGLREHMDTKVDAINARLLLRKALIFLDEGYTVEQRSKIRKEINSFLKTK